VLLLFALLAKTRPRRREPPKWKAYRGILREPDPLGFVFSKLYFGGFVAGSFLTTFFS